MRHHALAATVLLTAALIGAPWPAAAQRELRPFAGRRGAPPAALPPLAPAAPVGAYQTSASANQTVDELQRLLSQYPPNVRMVIQLDPTLLDRPDYLAPYPALAAFLEQHPDVRRNPSFFFGQPLPREWRDTRDPKLRAYDTLEGVLAGGALFTGIMIALGVVVSLLRELIDYRRWLRQSRVQADATTKVLDRMTSSEDLLRYLQTPAGAGLMQAAPAIADPQRIGGLPIGRILWSVQAGVVLASLGIGLWLVKGSVMEELAPGFIVMGTVAVSVGVGFIVSAAIAFLLTSRLHAFAAKS